MYFSSLLIYDFSDFFNNLFPFLSNDPFANFFQYFVGELFYEIFIPITKYLNK